VTQESSTSGSTACIAGDISDFSITETMWKDFNYAAAEA